MATLYHCNGGFAVISGDKFVHFTNRHRKQYQVPKADQKSDEQKDKEEEGQDVTKPDSENYVLAAGFSSSGKYFSVADNNKQLHVYSTNQDLQLLNTRLLQRRCTALTYIHSETDIIVADRTGDVYRFPLNQPEEEGELILGHLSMILDVKLTTDDQYIVTTDRDEKVRISHYPNAYNIHSYCLFHTEYVSQILYNSKLDCLISGSGDGRLATWSLDGRIFDNTEVKVTTEGKPNVESSNHGNIEVNNGENTEQNVAGIKKMVYDDLLNLIAVSYYSCKVISFYCLKKAENCVKIEKQSDVEVTEEPWDISFSTDQRLWVLQPCERDTVRVYRCEKHTDSDEVSISQDDEHCQTDVQYLNTNWEFFKASLSTQSDTISLQKIRTFDNMKMYMERKEERIKGEKKKQKNKDTANNEKPDKRLKTS